MVSTKLVKRLSTLSVNGFSLLIQSVFDLSPDRPSKRSSLEQYCYYSFGNSFYLGAFDAEA